VLYPQNGDRVVTIDSVTSPHPMYGTVVYALYTDAVISTLKEVGQYYDETCSRVRDVLLAPHKHKDRTARKAKLSGT